MAKDTKILTIPNLISAMKQAGFVTNDSLEKRLGKFGEGLRKQMNDDQFEARAEFYSKMTKSAIDKMGADLKIEITKVDHKVDKLSIDVGGIKDDLNGLTAEFSTHRHTSNLKN